MHAKYMVHVQIKAEITSCITNPALLNCLEVYDNTVHMPIQFSMFLNTVKIIILPRNFAKITMIF